MFGKYSVSRNSEQKIQLLKSNSTRKNIRGLNRKYKRKEKTHKFIIERQLI